MQKIDNKILQNAIKEMESKFGSGSLFALDNENKKPQDSIPTGSLMLDKAIGSGYPRGRITEIYGPEASGKTTLALHAIAEAQKLHKVAAFIDAEHALDIKYATNLGVNVKELLVSQPDSGEQALSIVESLVKIGGIDLIVIDSVAALVPEIELSGEISDQTIGAHARLMSKALRILIGPIQKANVAVIFINQLREKVGIIYGNPEVTTGGRALKFYSSLRLEIRKDSLIKDNEQNIGLRSKITVVKNKTNVPFDVTYTNIYFGKGFDYSNEIIDYASEIGVLTKAGTWYSYKETRLGQGKKQVCEFLNNNPSIFELIKKDTLGHIKIIS